MGTEDLGVVARAGLVPRLHEPPDPRRRDQQVAGEPALPGIAIRVRHSLRREDAFAGAGLAQLVAEPEPQTALDDVPRLVVTVVYVQRRDPLPVAVAGIRPLHDDEIARGTSEFTTRQRDDRTVARHSAGDPTRGQSAPPVAPALDVLAASVAETRRADDEDL